MLSLAVGGCRRARCAAGTVQRNEVSAWSIVGEHPHLVDGQEPHFRALDLRQRKVIERVHRDPPVHERCEKALGVGDDRLDSADAATEKSGDRRSRLIVDLEPDCLRGWTRQERQLAKVRVLGHDHVVVFCCVVQTSRAVATSSRTAATCWLSGHCVAKGCSRSREKFWSSSSLTQQRRGDAYVVRRFDRCAYASLGELWEVALKLAVVPACCNPRRKTAASPSLRSRGMGSRHRRASQRRYSRSTAINDSCQLARLEGTRTS